MKKTYALLAALALASSPLPAADLMEIYQRAQEADPQIAAASAAHRAALESKPQARGAWLPKLSLNGNINRTRSDVNDAANPVQIGTTQSYTASSYSLNLLQPLYHHDYYVQLRQADARVAQADAQLAAAQQGLVVRTANAYFLRLGAEDSLRFAEAERKAIEEQLRQARQRFEVGLIAITDVHEAQARYDLAVSQEIAARNQLDTARETLIELTGQHYAALTPLGDVPLVSPEPADVDQWVARALEQNLSLLAADAGSRVAQEEVRRQSAQGYPTVDMTASYGHSELPAFARDTDDATVGVQLSFPFYQGGIISSRTRQTEQLYQQALAQLEQQRRATVRGARDAYNGVQAGISQVQALRQAQTSAQTALDATQAGYEVGTRTAVDVLDAQRQLFLAERNYARARYDYVLSLLNLKQAAGSLSDEDLRQVNAWLK